MLLRFLVDDELAKRLSKGGMSNAGARFMTREMRMNLELDAIEGVVANWARKSTCPSLGCCDKTDDN